LQGNGTVGSLETLVFRGEEGLNENGRFPSAKSRIIIVFRGKSAIKASPAKEAIIPPF